jgi:hypothetical protein
VANLGLVRLSTFPPDQPPHFEQIGEIGREHDSELHAARLIIEIADAKPFEAASLPQEAGATNMNKVDSPLTIRSNDRNTPERRLSGERHRNRGNSEEPPTNRDLVYSAHRRLAGDWLPVMFGRRPVVKGWRRDHG